MIPHSVHVGQSCVMLLFFAFRVQSVTDSVLLRDILTTVTSCGEEEFCNYDTQGTSCERCDDVYPDCHFVNELEGQQECESKCSDIERRLSEPRKTFASMAVNHRRKLQSGGGSYFINYAQVIEPDLPTVVGSTFTVHGINHVLIPNTQDMLSTLEEQGEFTTLLSLIELAELGEAIMTTTPITLFGEDSFRLFGVFVLSYKFSCVHSPQRRRTRPLPSCQRMSSTPLWIRQTAGCCEMSC